jgi:outer membrane protein assembly factor BamB
MSRLVTYQFVIALWRAKTAESAAVKYWEIIVNKIIKAGFSVGWVSALDDYGRTVWTVDAHRDGKRFVVRADEKLTAFFGA